MILFNFSKTIGMVLISLIPFAILIFFTGFFLQIGIFFVLFIFAFLIMINSYLMKPIFEKLEAAKAKAEAEAAEEAAFSEDSGLVEESEEE